MSTEDENPPAIVPDEQFGQMTALLDRPRSVLPPLIAAEVPVGSPAIRVFPHGHRWLDPHRWFLHRAYTNLAIVFLGACVVVLRLRWMFIERSPRDYGFDVELMAQDLSWFEADFYIWFGLAVMALFATRMALDLRTHHQDLRSERSRYCAPLDFGPEWGAAIDVLRPDPDRADSGSGT